MVEGRLLSILLLLQARGRMTAPQLSREFEVRDGERACAFEARMLAQLDGTFLIIIRDISERKAAEARIEYLAYFDTLTSLPNRQMLMRQVNLTLIGRPSKTSSQ